MKLLFLALIGIVLAKDDCPDFRPESDLSECIWPRNAEGKMSFLPLIEAFKDKCKINLNLAEGQTLPDITDKVQIDVPEACGHCSYKFKCANREKKEGCFPLKADKETCSEGSFGDVCSMPKVPFTGDCRWGMLTGLMGQCVTARPDLPNWRREGYHQGGRFMPEQNCVPDGDGCKCCCHPYRPVKNGDDWTCEEAPNRAQADECPAFEEFNDWSKCLWYPLTQVAEDVNAHCALETLVPGVGKMIAARKTKEEKDESRSKMLEKLPKEKCGYCAFKVRCRKRAQSDVCFGFDGDKKACGPDDCEGCGEPCSMGIIEAGPKVPEATVGTCDYHKLIMGYLRSRAGGMMKFVGKSYWKKRGFMGLMKFMPMGKCVQAGDGCKCCCHPYEPSADGSTCELKSICRTPDDMGLDWDTSA